MANGFKILVLKFDERRETVHDDDPSHLCTTAAARRISTKRTTASRKSAPSPRSTLGFRRVPKTYYIVKQATAL